LEEKVKILLVSPFRGALFECAGVRLQPLGLSYVGAALLEAGHEIEFAVMHDPSSLPDFLDFQAVGISCTTTQFKPGLAVARAAKAAGKIVVLGGPHPTGCPDEALASGVVDYVVRAEGEATAVELFGGLEQKRFEPSKILGLSWIDESTGRIVHNPPRPFIENLDELPWPVRESRGLQNENTGDNRETYYPVVTTRGCPFGCRFCDVGNLAGRRFRIRANTDVVDEIENLVHRHGARKIAIVDDIINFDRPRLVQFCDEVLRRRLQVVFWVMGRADRLVAHPDTAARMAEAGVRTMFLGIESPSKRVLKAYKKGGKASHDVSVRAVETLHRHGIETWGAFMMGEPSETREEVEMTIRFAKELNPGTAQFTVLTPYPGTPLWQDVEHRLTTRDWNLYDAMHSVFKLDHLNAQELESLCRKAYREFYLQPRRIARAIFRRGRVGRPNLRLVSKVVKAMNTVYSNRAEGTATEM
jgi:anaerobic magnesium-protoporphyrin IX monomethyl ester cyclase